MRSDFTGVTCFLTADSFEGFVEVVHNGVDRYGTHSDLQGAGWTRCPVGLGGAATSSCRRAHRRVQVTYDFYYDGSKKDVQVIIVPASPTLLN